MQSIQVLMEMQKGPTVAEGVKRQCKSQMVVDEWYTNVDLVIDDSRHQFQHNISTSQVKHNGKAS